MKPAVNNQLGNTTVSDQSAQAALVGFTVLFFSVLAIGWHRFFATAIFAPASWAIAIALAVFAILLARMVAAEKIRVKLQGHEKDVLSDNYWIFYFMVLFSISALGTMNTEFYFGEGKVVLLEAIDGAQQNLDSIDSIAPKILTNPQLEQKQATINRLLSSLDGEISNANGGNSCGIGVSARKIIQEIKVELPNFREFSGAGVYTCSGSEEKNKALSNSYKKQAYQLLRNDPIFVAANIAQNEVLLNSVHQRVTQEKAQLDAAKLALGSGADSSLSNGDNYANAQHALESAASSYAKMRIELDKASSTPFDLPRTISVASTRQLGSFAQIIPSLLGRMGHISTWIYIVFAILMDVILIIFFTRVMRGAQQTGNMNYMSDNNSTERDLGFLWVNSR